MTQCEMWPCTPRDLVADVEALRCFGKFESECAASALLKLLQRGNLWVEFTLREFEYHCRGDEMPLLGFGFLLERKWLLECDGQYAASIHFAQRILKHQRRR